MAEEKKTFMMFVLERLKIHIVGLIILFLTSTVALITTPVGERVKQIWRTPVQLDEIGHKLEALAVEVRRATGEDRVISETLGLSYVVEPVFKGDPVTLNLVVKRTRTGAACYLRNRTALFTDETNIAAAGETIKPARQLGTTETPLRLTLNVPPQVRIGRVTVYLSLEFDCGGVTVFDQTRPVPFMIRQREG